MTRVFKKMGRLIPVKSENTKIQHILEKNKKYTEDKDIYVTTNGEIH